jgi:hypothetical protein
VNRCESTVSTNCHSMDVIIVLMCMVAIFYHHCCTSLTLTTTSTYSKWPSSEHLKERPTPTRTTCQQLQRRISCRFDKVAQVLRYLAKKV